MQSINKLNQSLSRSRFSGRKSNSSAVREKANISRSKSSYELGGRNSRVKLLGEIAAKLEERKEE